MNPERKELLAELEALQASYLKQAMEEKFPAVFDDNLDEKMIRCVYRHLTQTKKEATVIDLQAGMRRSRGNISLIFRMVAGIAAIFIMGFLSYRTFFSGINKTADCQGKNLLSCLTQQTSGEEIYIYLMQDYAGTEDVYLFEKVHATPSDQISVELQ
jgi:hypothetical protein